MDQRMGLPDLSVDAPLQGDADVPLLSMLPDGEDSAEELLADKQLKALVKDGIGEFSLTLNSNEQVVLQNRMLGEETATLQDLAEELSLSRERIRQIENRVKEKLKEFLVERFGSIIEDM